MSLKTTHDDAFKIHVAMSGVGYHRILLKESHKENKYVLYNKNFSYRFCGRFDQRERRGWRGA